MNKGIVLLIAGLSFVGGCVTGVLCTKETYKKKYQEISDKEIDDIKEFYLGESKRKEYETDEEMPDFEEETMKKTGLEKRAEISKRIESRNENTAYNKMYRHDEEEEEYEMTPEDEANEYHEKHRNDTPRLIRQGEIDELPGHIDSQALFLYTGDRVVTDDCDNVVDQPEYIFGNSLADVDLDAEQENGLIFIFNPELDVVYEINLISGDYPGAVVTSMGVLI